MKTPDSSWLPAHWDIIRFDAAQFLTPHAGRGAQIYRDLLDPGVAEDLKHGLRAIAAGVVRQLQGVMRARRSRFTPSRGQPYLMVITPGTGKYAREDREVKEACASRGLPVIRVLSDSREVQSDDHGQVPLPDLLTARDHARVLARWLHETVRLAGWRMVRDRKARSLWVVAIPGIRQYYLDLAFARRIEGMFGPPMAVLSLAPWSDTSVAIVDAMKARGIPTGATRTQTTIDIEEHLAINADLLFCKSTWERDMYGRMFGGHGPRLVDACLLSLPEEYSLEPLELTEPFVLLLGTTRQWNESEAEYRRAAANLERVAAVPGLPVVYRPHPAQIAALDQAAGSTAGGGMLVVTDLRRNHELIARASCVVSAHSTLLYPAILAGVPTVVVDVDPPGTPADEFVGSPLLRIRAGEIDDLTPDDLEPARQLATDARRWFASNYFLDRGAGYMVDRLLELRG